MCGRYVSPDEAAIERAWHVGRQNNNPFSRRFNVAPTSMIPFIAGNKSGQLEVSSARWGLIPSWWKEIKPPRYGFNARFEEIATKPMWRQPMRNARCLVPAEGWYEWQAVEHVEPNTGEVLQGKHPQFIHRKDRQPFCFAGLMSVWVDPATNEPVVSCSILTKAASESIAAVHDRMPVVLPDAAHAAWIDARNTDTGKACKIVHDCAIADFKHYSVSARVNTPKHDDALLMEPIAVS